MKLPRQIALLMWKNWLLQKRRVWVSIFEVLLPVAFAVLFVIIRGLIKTKVEVNPTYYKNQSVILDRSFFQNNSIIGYAPNTSETTEIMKYVESMLANYTFNGSYFEVKPFKTEDAAVDFYIDNSDVMRHLIVFDNVNGKSSNLPKNVSFTVRPHTGTSQWRTDLTYPVFQTGSPSDDAFLYRDRGVLYMQSLVGDALAKYWLSKLNKSDSMNFDVYSQRMAYPPFFGDPIITIIQTLLPLFLVISFIISVIINTKNLVYEKERKLKESMKLMGLTSSAHWLAWLFTFSIYLIPAMAIYAVLFGIKVGKEGSVLSHSDPSLFFVYLLCYALALMTYCFMVSTFVQKANVGAIVSGILFLAFYFPYFFINSNYEDLSKSSKIVASILFNSAMALGANCFGIYEGTGEGAQWYNFHKPGTVDDNLSLLDCMIMLLVDSLIHFIITWYLDNILPGEFGVPKPVYFCFTKSYWCSNSSSWDTEHTNEVPPGKYFEKEPTGREAGIRICNLKKVFNRKVAVAGTSLNMYEGQITVLLGHNGAGKTTTMSMLTGFIPPTGGTAYVNGCDIRNNITGVRSSLGLCPQHDILFDTLTVEEHLEFFAKLKGLKGPKVQEEVFAMAKEVGLETKIKTMSQNLSGGQKRKLSVGIALIGGSKVVILDEPSSGMDPAARRQIWGVLQRAREGRTLVLSTHYMDEADVLGDRTAIMAEGVVKCCGSSLFLKKLYGAGYHLIVVKKPDCDIDALTRVVKSFVRTAEFETIINTEVTYLLPDNEASQFPNLFRELEDTKEQLKIDSFGTTATTMEEVFLKVGETASDENDIVTLPVQKDYGSIETGYINHSFENGKSNHYNLNNGAHHGTFGAPNRVDVEKQNLECEAIDIVDNDIMAFNKGFSKLTGWSLQLSRCRALFVKKAIHTWRNRIVTFVQLLLPVLFTIVGLGADEARPKGTPQPPLKFNLVPFDGTYIPYTDGINASSSATDMTHIYGSQFEKYDTPEYFSLSGKATFDNYTLKRAAAMTTSIFNKKMIIGTGVSQTALPDTLSAVAYYNGQPFHAQPISMNYLMNTILQFSLNDTSYNLMSSINPLPKDAKAAANSNIVLNMSAGFSIGFFITFGMSFLTTLFMYFLIKERQVGAKHMQVVSGIGPVTYWLPTFLWDFINYIIPSLLLLVVFAAFSKSAYLDDGRWGVVILLLAIYGWAVLPFMYAVQFAFKAPATGVVVVILLNIVTGLVTTIAVFVLKFPDLNLLDVAKALDWIFTILFPNYNMASCFINMYTNYLNQQICEPQIPFCPIRPGACCKDSCTGSLCFQFNQNYMSLETPGIGKYLIFMAIQGAVFFLLVTLIEYHFFQRIWYLIRGAPDSASEYRGFENNTSTEDSDVAAERQRINSSPASVLSTKDSLLLVNLYKRYTNFVAVDHVCLGVPDQECFGLLGQNGAGKTTTFKMLTGDVMVTGGNAYLKGFDVRSDIKQVQANMGYCPQFDALIDQMTGRETLIMYARLRGVPESSINTVVETLIDILMLRPHADKLAGLYSGGNKRKLSTAIALVGDPPFIMLDEPSSGMDPKARRQLWNVLSQVRASGRTLVLTSHSMEECDALCTRIAIMVNGRFMCLGSPQHLKNKFGQGYTLIAQLGVLADGTIAPNQPVIDFIVSHFPGTMVFDDHQGYIHFQVPDARVKLADVFSLMETAKKSVNVQDYSVHQTTLEQVFLTFTRAQIQPKEEKPKRCLPSCC